MRTTVDIDAPVLRDLKRLRKQEGKTLGALVSELLATALALRGKPARTRKPFTWVSRPMQARIDPEDREAVWKLLSEEEFRP